jgi:hypothetical protein
VRVGSAPKRTSYPQDEGRTPEDDTECDADEDADRGGVEDMVDEEAEDHPTDDAADEHTAEPDEVATS